MTIRISSLSIRYIKVNEEDKQEISIIEIIMIKDITRIDIGLIVEVGEHHIEIEISMDKAIKEEHAMLIIIEMT